MYVCMYVYIYETDDNGKVIVSVMAICGDMALRIRQMIEQDQHVIYTLTHTLTCLVDPIGPFWGLGKVVPRTSMSSSS